MAHLLELVRRSVARRRLFGPGPLLVACSGGPDSTALVHVLHRLAPELGLALSVASVDHGLRPEAPAEVALVGRLAASLGLPFTPLVVDVDTSQNVQAAARQARYEALFALARREGVPHIAVGHSLDDQAETVLARVLRGAGLSGLSAVDPARADGVLRPLIDAPRALIHAYVREQGLETVADPSNDDTRFERVRIRRALMPALEAEDPRVREHLADLADEARALTQMLSELSARALALEESPRALSLSSLRAHPAPLRRAILRAWLERETGQPPQRAHLLAIEGIASEREEVLLPRGFDVSLRGSMLFLRHRSKRSGRAERPTH